MSGFLTASAMLLTYAVHELYDDLSAATLTLTGTKPSVAFKCSITLSAATGHADCLGDVYINAEKISFLQAATKTSTTNLTAMPVVTTANLDCNIKITCIDTGNAPIEDETQTAISCDWDESTTWYPNAQGTYSRSDSNCETDNITAKIADKVLFNGKTYTVKNIKDGETTLGGTVLTKVLQFA